jgi:adenylate cyclase
VAATLLCTLLYLGHRGHQWTLPAVDAWERSTIDMRFNLRGPRDRLDDRVVIVGLDNETRRHAPEAWQTRRGFATLIRKLTEAQPRAIGIDAFFASPEINLSASTIAVVQEARAQLSTEESPSPGLVAAREALQLVITETSGDDLLADAVASSKMLVLASLFYLDGEPYPPGTAEAPGLDKGRFDESVHLPQPPGKRAPRASGDVAPLEKIGAVVSHMGHVNVDHDLDGAVRQAPLVIERAGRYHQSLSLKLASMERGEPTSYVAGEDFITLGDQRIQLSPQGFARIGFLGGNGKFPRISALEVLQHDGPHPALKDRIVLVGFTDTARDKIETPFEQSYDGVELHATLIHNLLHDQLIQRSTPEQTVAALLIIGLLLALLQIRKVRDRGAFLGVGAFVVLAGYAILCQILFNVYDLQLELVVPSLALVATTLAAMTVSLATEGREKAQIRSAFGQYLQSSLIEKLLQDPERLRLGGQRRELTVLFSDIRNFSRFSEKLEPDVLSDLLNEYLTPMTDIVMDNSGMLDKYIGDAVMAVYGAPIPLDDHAERACASALLMLEKLGPLNEFWSTQDLPEIRIGIGINTGPMSVGNMGSQARFDYTVMGDSVNLGARLESLTKVYGVGVLVGESTKEAAEKRFVFREIDSVRVIGRSAAARVYQLCGSKEAPPFTDDELSLFQRGLEAYRDRRWSDSIECFDSFLQEHPEDGPAKTMRARIASLQTQDLGSDWDGVYEQSNK